MPEWINIIVTLLAFAAVWWRLAVRAAEKRDIVERRNEMNGAEEDLQKETERKT